MRYFLVEGEFQCSQLSILEIKNYNYSLSLKKYGHGFWSSLYLTAEDIDDAEEKFKYYINNNFKPDSLAVIDVCETVKFK
jgi:hypothetical protein